MKQSWSFPATSHVSGGEFEIAEGEKTGRLVIQFNGGGIYAYDVVPQEIVNRLKEATSPGRFLNSEVKGRFTFTKLA